MYQNGYEEGSVVIDFENGIVVLENTIALPFVFTLKAKAFPTCLKSDKYIRVKRLIVQLCLAISKLAGCKLAADTSSLAMHIFLDEIGVQKEGVHLSA